MALPSSDSYAAIPSGSNFAYSTDGGTVYVELCNITGIGAIGQTGTFIDCTTLCDTSTKAIPGLREAPEVTFTFIDAPDETDWTAFLALADAGENVTIRIWFPNGRQVVGDYALNGSQMVEPDTGSVISFTVNARQNSIVWSTGEAAPAFAVGSKVKN